MGGREREGKAKVEERERGGGGGERREGGEEAKDPSLPPLSLSPSFASSPSSPPHPSPFLSLSLLGLERLGNFPSRLIS